jgi:hypothetical protein
VIAVVDMNPFDTDVPAENNGNSAWFGVPDESQLPDLFAALGIPYSDGSSDWVNGIGITRPDGSTWQPYANLPGPDISSGDIGGWSSPLTPTQTPVPTATPTTILPPVAPIEFTIPGMTEGWWSPLTPAGVPASPAATPTPTQILSDSTIPGTTGGWWSPLTPAEIPVMPTQIPAAALTPDVGYSGPHVVITELNLGGKYLKLKNNEMTPVVLTGWKISNGQGRSITFIDWPRGDGTTFTFVLYPLNTVTVYYGREGTVTADALYWPTGADAWSRPGDTAYLYNPQGRLASSLTA